MKRFFKNQIDWITEDQLISFGSQIVESIELQIGATASGSDLQAALQKLIQWGYLHGYIFGFFTRSAGPLLLDAGVRLEKFEENEDWLKRFVVGNLINEEMAETFDPTCRMFTSQGSASYLKGVRDGDQDADLMNEGKPPVGFLMMEMLVAGAEAQSDAAKGTDK